MIPIFKPSMGEEEVNAVREVINSRFISPGPKTDEFEKNFATYIGAKHAIAVNSGTAALHLAVKALNISSGEIIIPPITFISTAYAASYNDATPVFADVEEDTLNINPDDVKKKITEKTKAIIPVHFGGHPCEMDELNEIAKEHGLKIIEDAAHACGSEYKGKKVGLLGNIGCFSFHPVKNLTTAGGGMIVTNDDAIATRLRKLRWLGINKDTFHRHTKGYDWHYEIEETGFQYHIDDIKSAIGVVQLKKLDEMNEKRRKIVEHYNKSFRDLNWIKLPVEKNYVKSALHNYVIKVEDRDKLISFLKENEISAGVHYMSINLHPIYKNLQADIPVAQNVWKKIVTLPLFPDMTKGELDKIVECVRNFKK